MLSCIFHRKNPPAKLTEAEEVELSNEEIIRAEVDISSHLSEEFSFEDVIQKINSIDYLKELYAECTSNCEKLQIFRIVFDRVNLGDVFKQYINKTYQVIF